jgi:hypothetical protein
MSDLLIVFIDVSKYPRRNPKMPRDGQENPQKLSAGILYFDILVGGKDSNLSTLTI